jgi:hypothetical protein
MHELSTMQIHDGAIPVIPEAPQVSAHPFISAQQILLPSLAALVPAYKLHRDSEVSSNLWAGEHLSDWQSARTGQALGGRLGRARHESFLHGGRPRLAGALEALIGSLASAHAHGSLLQKLCMMAACQHGMASQLWL